MDQIGATLRAAREAKGISIQEVEEETKIRAKYLAALESGQFEQIPGIVYAKGFLRTYANFLGLDGTQLVERLRVGLEPPPPEVKGRTATAEHRPERSPVHPPPASPRTAVSPPAKSVLAPTRTPEAKPRWPAGVIAVVLLAGLGVGGWAWLAGHGTPAQAPQPTPSASPGPQPTPSAPPSTAQPVAPTVQPVLAVTPGAITDGTWPITVKGASTLTVQVHLPHDAWLKVVADGADKSDDVTYKAGTDPTFTGKQSLVIETGWPENLKLTVNGQDLPAITYTPRLTINVSLTH